MHFIVLKESFAKALSIVGKAIPNRPQLPILSNVLLKATDNQLIISSTNLELGIVYTLPVKVEEKGEIAIPGKILTEFISNIHGEQVEFILEGSQLKIKSGKTMVTLVTTNPDDFPPFPEIKSFDKKLPFKSLDEVIPRVVFASSSDEARPVLTGVRLMTVNDSLSLTATDGYRLSVDKVLIPSMKEDFVAIIPALTLIEVNRIGNEVKADEVGFTILKEKNQVVFSLPQVLIYSRMIDGEFPPIEKIIPQSFKTRTTFKKEELFQAVKTASLFARGSANVVKVAILKDQVKLSANTPQVGSHEETLEANIEGEEIEIAFNYRFLLDLMNNFPGDDVILETSGNLNPGLFKSSSSSSFFHIIMPVRVQG